MFTAFFFLRKKSYVFTLVVNMCRRWLLGITDYGIVRRQSVYDNSVKHTHIEILYYDEFSNSTCGQTLVTILA